MTNTTITPTPKPRQQHREGSGSSFTNAHLQREQGKMKSSSATTRKPLQSIDGNLLSTSSETGGAKQRPISQKALPSTEALRNRNTSSIGASLTIFKDAPSLQRDVASTPSPTAMAYAEIPEETKNDEGECIQVAVRMRALPNSQQQTNTAVWKVDPATGTISEVNGKNPSRTYSKVYDKVFDETTSTRQVYDSIAVGIVQSVCRGKNGTIFCYGQTSSGKTYTMQGAGRIQDGGIQGDSSSGGMVHFCARDLFAHIENEPDTLFTVQVSYVEIYNEQVRDLLHESRNTLDIQKDERGGVSLKAMKTCVQSPRELLDALARGEASRKVAATAMNERSSRSHSIFIVTVESRKCSITRTSTLYLVDLAGSECAGSTGATGDRQREGGAINKSLLALGNVIKALESKQTFIPYRGSNLTRLLEPSLSGNARIAMVCCTTPADIYVEETRSTLQFASTARRVKTHAAVNQVQDQDSLIQHLQKQVTALKRQLELQKSRPNETTPIEDAAKTTETEANLFRIQSLLLNSGRRSVPTRRYSDVHQQLPLSCQTPRKTETVLPRTVARCTAATHNNEEAAISPRTEASFLRQALAVKQQAIVRVQHAANDGMQARDEYLEQLRQEHDESEETLQEKEWLLEEKSKKLEQKQEECCMLERKVRMLRDELDAARNEVDRTDENWSEQVKKLQADRDALEVTKDVLQHCTESLEKEVAAEQEEKNSLEEQHGRDQERIEELEARIGDLESQQNKYNQASSTHREEVHDAKAQVESITRLLETTQSELGQANHKVEELEGTVIGLQNERDELDSRVGDLEYQQHKYNQSSCKDHEELQRALAQVETVCHQLETAQSELGQANERIVELEGNVENLRTERDAAVESSAETSALLAQVLQKEEHEEGKKRVLQDKMARLLEEQHLDSEDRTTRFKSANTSVEVGNLTLSSMVYDLDKAEDSLTELLGSNFEEELEDAVSCRLLRLSLKRGISKAVEKMNHAKMSIGKMDVYLKEKSEGTEELLQEFVEMKNQKVVQTCDWNSVASGTAVAKVSLEDSQRHRVDDREKLRSDENNVHREIAATRDSHDSDFVVEECTKMKVAELRNELESEWGVEIKVLKKMRKKELVSMLADKKTAAALDRLSRVATRDGTF